MDSHTTVMEFILLGVADGGQVQYVLFATLLGICILTLTGNILIITTTLINHHPRTPMYFFLGNFSILEICFTTTVIPKALANLVLKKKTIFLRGCLTQNFLYLMLGATEFLLLAVISFDQYVAICKPLCYVTVMNSQVCSLLVVRAWIGGAVLILSQSAAYFQMPFCGSNVINHFFCDSTQMISLKCGNTKVLVCTNFTLAVFILLGSLTITDVSYINIITTVVKTPSVAGRQRTFSTLAPHLTLVSFTYNSCIFMYLTPTQTNRLDLSKVVSILNTVISPRLNPLIYSLRNTQFQEAVKESIKWSIAISKHPEI